MTTKNKYGQHNKRKNARASKKRSASRPTITVGASSPTDSLMDKIRQAEMTGADCILDFTEDGRVIALAKDEATGEWGVDHEVMMSIARSMAEMGL